MSDIQDLIHKTSMDCIEKGKSVERERIITIIREEYGATMEGYTGADWIIALIEGETNAASKI
jgi:hypothetical protein